MSAALRHRPIADRPEKGGTPIVPDEEPGAAQTADMSIGEHAYWSVKLNRNKQRDSKKTIELGKAGIRVVRFWEYDVQNDIERCVNVIQGIVSQRRS